MIDWLKFLEVLLVSIVGAGAVVSLYATGLRLLAVSGRTPFVAPREFEDAITVLTPKELKKEEKRAMKARRKNPYTEAQKRIALAASYVMFVLAALVVLYGLYLIAVVPRLQH